MASKKKSAAKNTPAVTIVGLAAIIAATQTEAGFAFVGTDEANKLEAEGFVETNADVPNTPAGQIATRATKKGIDFMKTQNSAEKAQDTAGKKSEFVIEDNVEIPAVSGRGRVGSLYPFDDLKVGQSFFVPKAAKNLASTVSSANARYAEEVPGETRKDRKGNEVPKMKFTRHFIVRSVEGGSRIWRKS